ncbi:MAG TPA: RNA-binding protein [Candidatus Kryptonia bacterium]|nr:RNA-binding protein [Candidatus Kryptonia bacterium]
MGKKLHVGNLAYAVTEEDLRQAFSAAGTCESVAVIMDRATGQSRGFGFVEMSSDAEAQRAVEQLDGKDIKGRAIKVSEAREREGGGGGGRGGPGGGWRRR